MRPNKLKISIDLKPEVSQDPETGQYIAKFEGLPTIAFDETPEKAVLRLISIFEVFLNEQKELVYERLLKKHIEQALQDPSYRLIQIQEFDNDHHNEMKLQLVS